MIVLVTTPFGEIVGERVKNEKEGKGIYLVNPYRLLMGS